MKIYRFESNENLHLLGKGISGHAHIEIQCFIFLLCGSCVLNGVTRGRTLGFCLRPSSVTTCVQHEGGAGNVAAPLEYGSSHLLEFGFLALISWCCRWDVFSDQEAPMAKAVAPKAVTWASPLVTMFVYKKGERARAACSAGPHQSRA